jgi:tetratricopeptide (TPR) repeat protein
MNKIGFLLLSITAFLGANNQKNFIEANGLYTKKQYEKALALFKIIDGGSCALWQNMGNCHYHLKHYIDALVCWKRAERFSSIAEYDQLQNQVYGVYQKINKIDSCSVLSKFIARTNRYLRCMPLIFLQILFIMIWLFMLYMYGVYKGSKRILWLLLLVMANLFFGSIVLMRYWYDAPKTALVIKEAVLVEGTDKNYQTLKSIPLADHVYVLSKKDAWYKVKHKGSVGWLLADMIQSL